VFARHLPTPLKGRIVSNPTKSRPSERTPEWVRTLTVSEMDADTDAIFDRLRAESPLVWVPALNAWIATTWELCADIAANADDFHGGTNPMLDRLFGVPHILGAEGEVHSALRSVIDPALRPRVFKSQLEQRVRPVAAAQLGALAHKGSADLMAEYFEPVSVRCVADAFGFDSIPTDQLRRWFHTLAKASANTTDADGNFLDPRGFDEADEVRQEVRSYLTMLAVMERAEPDGEARSRLFRTGLPEGVMRDVEDLLPSLLIIFLGGLQEPGHACGTTYLALETHQEQRQQVMDDIKVLPRAIAEALRWMSPLYAGSSRIAARDLNYGGQELKEGEPIWLAYGSANHDEINFDRAAMYDLNREQRPNLAFGTGRHACPGSAFAPQVARIALEELYRLLPSVHLDPDHTPTPTGWLFRGVRELPSVWDAADS
jgi:cytochrome P450